MNQRIPFWKMHGAANDFIVVDDRALTFPAHDSVWLQHIMRRQQPFQIFSWLNCSDRKKISAA